MNMEKFLLKDHPINLKFSVMNHNNGGNYRRGNAASAGAPEFFKPRHGQEYAKTKLPLLNFKRFQNLLPTATPSAGQKCEKIFIYFLCPMVDNHRIFEDDSYLNKIRIYGSPLDQLLAQ
ncbi:hypothetical protein Ocin01_12168 [Orchesella cincta]|uniref:Uncharacterized protein n=1 Tax=Orchesella cincta TaxID=48709 RepID=A0A1D2MNP2_ORCCI|nr:hypothetical protein Ocin01_12168 [Orchesella cincta]